MGRSFRYVFCKQNCVCVEGVSSVNVVFFVVVFVFLRYLQGGVVSASSWFRGNAATSAVIVSRELQVGGQEGLMSRYYRNDPCRNERVYARPRLCSCAAAFVFQFSEIKHHSVFHAEETVNSHFHNLPPSVLRLAFRNEAPRAFLCESGDRVTLKGVIHAVPGVHAVAVGCHGNYRIFRRVAY